MNRKFLAAVLLFSWLFTTPAVAQYGGVPPPSGDTGSGVDDFEDGSTMGWRFGMSLSDNPRNVADGGPDGAEDNYLEVSASGGSGAGSRSAILNRSQWTGDWTAAGIDRISAYVLHVDRTSPLNMRIAVSNATGQSGTWFVSQSAQQVSNSEGWVLLNFNLSDLTRGTGTASLDQVLSSVAEFRFVNTSVVSHMGDQIAVTFGLDDIKAETEEPNEAPVAQDLSIEVAAGESVDGTLNASDADGDPLTYSIVSAPSQGSVTITDSATGAFTYTANEGASDSDSFTYKANDGTDDSNTATVTVSIGPSEGVITTIINILLNLE